MAPVHRSPPRARSIASSTSSCGSRRGIIQGCDEKRAPIRCSARATKGTRGSRGRLQGFLSAAASGRSTPITTTTTTPTLTPLLEDRACREDPTAAGIATGFEATVMGLGELRTTAHINAKRPLYNFLARCKGTDRRIGGAEYWRGLVETWCKEQGMGAVDLSTKQVSLYLRQMAKDPSISSYYGISKIEQSGPYRFALEGRRYDWSRYHHSHAPPAGWKVVSKEDGSRTFSSCERGGDVQVRIKKPSYAQVCQVEAIKVNGFDNTYDTVFNPACDHRAFAAPESLHQMLEAIGSIALCKGIRRKDVPSVDAMAFDGNSSNEIDKGIRRYDENNNNYDTAGRAEFSRLVRRSRKTAFGDSSSTDRECPRSSSSSKGAVSANMGKVGSEDVVWSSECFRVLKGSSQSEQMGDNDRDQGISGQYLMQRCGACEEYLETSFLLGVRKAAAATTFDSGAACDWSTDGDHRLIKLLGKYEKQNNSTTAPGAKRERVSNSQMICEDFRIHNSAPCSDVQKQGGLINRDLSCAAELEGVVPRRFQSPVEGTSGCSPRGYFQARKVPCRGKGKHSKRRRKSHSTILAQELSKSETFRHFHGRDVEVFEAALGLSTLRTVPRDRCTWKDAVTGSSNMAC